MQKDAENIVIVLTITL